MARLFTNLSNEDLNYLPGSEIICQGLSDLKENKESIASLLVAIGYPRLKLLGLQNLSEINLFDSPENRLYKILAKEWQKEAHSQYNALIRRLVSFEHALESRIYRIRRTV